MGVFARWAAGDSLEALAKDYGVTRERVRFWLTKAALSDSNIDLMPKWRLSRDPDDEE